MFTTALSAIVKKKNGNNIECNLTELWDVQKIKYCVTIGKY